MLPLTLHPLISADICNQVEELKTSPNEPTESAPALVAKALDQELNAAAALVAQQKEVNDLTGLVKKKKKNPESNGATPSSSNCETTGKRKAEDDVEDGQSEKKAKLEAPETS